MILALLMLCNCKIDEHNKEIMHKNSTMKSSKKYQEKENPERDNVANKNKEVEPSYLSIAYCMGKFSPEKDDNFVVIDQKYADRPGMYLRKETYAAFKKMYQAAQKEGIKLVIRSATRNFDYQKGIWERKWTGKTLVEDGTNVSKDIKEPIDKALKILNYSSMPGTSRHHWGSEIDLNSFDNSFFEKGQGKKLFDWLTSHAGAYGFCRPYTAKGPQRPYGYNEEKWHWSYMPISKPCTEYASKHLKNEMIKGFLGDNTPPKIDVVHRYILGIDSTCMK